MKPLCLLVIMTICLSSFAQEVTIQAFPDKHLTPISGIDVDSDANNALTVSSAGKTIFWDLSSKKPLRIWEYEKTAFDVSMILDNNTGACTFFNESHVNIVLYNLNLGYAYDTLQIKIPENQELMAYSMGPKSSNQQKVAFLFSNQLVVQDLYRRDSAKTLPLSIPIQDITYLGDQIILIGENTLHKVDDTYTGIEAFNTEHILNFNSKNIRNRYHVSREGDNIVIQDILPFGKNYKFKNESNLDPGNIAAIIEGNKSPLLQIDYENHTEFMKLSSDVDGIKWNKKVISLMDKRAVWDVVFVKNKSMYAFTDYARSIQFIDEESGDDLLVIKNEQPRERLSYMSPDFMHMVYTDRPTAGQETLDPNPPATYYLDMQYPDDPFYLFQGTVTKSSFSIDSSFITLTEFGLQEVSTRTGGFHVVDYGHIEGQNVPLKDFSYDHTSDNILLHFEKGIPARITDNLPTSPREMGFVVNAENDVSASEIDKIKGQNSIAILNRRDKSIKQVLAFGDKKKNARLIAGGRYVYLENTNKTNPQLYDCKTNQFLAPIYDGTLTNIVIDKEGTQVLFRYSNKYCFLANLLPEFQLINSFEIEAIPVMMALNPKMQQIIFRDYQDDTTLFAYFIGNNETYEMDSVYCSEYQDISKDGKFLALKSKKAVQIVNLIDGTNVTSESKSFEASPAFIRFSEKLNMAISGRYSGRLNIWNLDAKMMIGTILLNQSGQFVAYDNMGFFDCSPSAMDDIYYSVRKEIVGLDQLKEEYWEPGLIQYLYENEAFSEEENKELREIPLYPDVKLSTSKFQDSLYVELFENQGGIGKVSFFINNVEVEEDINAGRERTIDLSLVKYADILVPDRPNILGIVVYNDLSEGIELKSRQKRIPIEYKKEKTTDTAASFKSLADQLKKAQARMLDPKKTRLIGLIVGTTDYDGSEIDLNYADNDANSMEEALRKTGKLLFKDDNKVIIHKYISRSSVDSLKSTRKNIIAKMNKLESDTKVDDIVVLYFSGHGVTQKENFYYLTKEANATTMKDTTDKLKDVTIAADEINDFLKKSKSLRKLLILDACYSGAAVNAFVQKSGNNSSATQRKAMDQLKDKTGVYVLSSSLQEQESVELKALNQGAMTYSLLDGMSGSAAVDDVIQVTNLINHVIKKVPKLAKLRGHKQQPIFISPEASMPFAIGISDKSVSPVGAKVQIGRSAVVDSTFTDPLNINDAIDALVEKVSNEEGNVPFQWNDLASRNNVTVRGMYVEENGNLILHASIIQQNKRINKLKITKPDANQIAQELVEQLKIILKKENI